MNNVKLLTLLSFFLCCFVFSQENETNNVNSLLKKIHTNQKKSLVSNDALIALAEEFIGRDQIAKSQKIELINMLLSHYVEKEQSHQFKRMYKQYYSILKKSPLHLSFWEHTNGILSQEFEQSLISARSHLKESKRNSDNDDIATSFRILAKSFMTLNLKDSSLYYADLSLNYARRSDSEHAVLNTFKTQSEIYNHFGMIGKSTSVLIKLIDEAEKIRDYKSLCWGTIQIAHKSFQIRYYNEAKTYLRKALSIAEKNDASFFKGVVHRYLAEISLALNDIDEAIQHLNRGKPFIDPFGQTVNNSLTLLTYAKISIIESNYNLANKQLNEALNQFEFLRFNDGMAKTFNLFGKLFFKKENWNKSEEYYKKSMMLLTKDKFNAIRIDNHKYLAEIYANQKDYTLAFKNLEEYEKYTNINSSISSTKAINELTQMYSRELREYRIKEQEQVISNQKREKELLALKSDKQFSTIILIVILMVSVIIIIVFYLRQLKIKQQRQEVEMSQTLLRTQMNPHFIFNAMSVIQSYIYENDPKKSSKFLVSFSRLIRLILENSPKEFITIETEVEILEKYLKTQKLRFENRFEFKISVPEELIFKKVMIPPMITQPFVENSIEHGRLNVVENGHIHIKFEERENRLFVMIEDNGVGRNQSTSKKLKKDHQSMALNITKERVNILNKKHKSKSALEIKDLKEGKYTGTLVELYLPLLNENVNFE
mgnify:CR=1 FL=1